MLYIKGKSGLILPKYTGSMSSKREISMRSMEEWRQKLPVTDLSASSKALYITLQDIHQAAISCELRFQILSFLRPTVSYLTQALQKLYFDKEISTEHQRLIADLVYALNFEMLNGYKIVLDSLVKEFFCDKKLLMGSLHSALHYCDKILFHAYEQYRFPPSGIWLEFHRLFALADKKKVAYKPLSKVIDWHTRFDTLADMYKHFLLFSIANPHRLRRDEINHLSYALENWAPLLNISKSQHKDSSLFVVDINSDVPPKYTSLYFQPPKECYYMNMDKVIDRLHKLLSLRGGLQNSKLAKAFSSSELALPHNFLESLLSAWRSLNERAHERQKIHGHVSICLGIAASHWFISNEKFVSSDENLADTSQDAEVIDIDVASNEQNTNSNTIKYKRYVCELIDQSEGGFCLKWLKEIPTQLQCGEIVALEKEVRPGKKAWTIGTIRWLKNEEDQTILIGIQVLSPEVIPVKACLSNTQMQHAMPTLLFPDQAQSDKPMTLVTPSLPFKTGQEIDIEYENQIYPVCLQKSYSLSPSYQEFGLEFLHQRLVVPPEAITSNILVSGMPSETV